jgi:hypothetical protein
MSRSHLQHTVEEHGAPNHITLASLEAIDASIDVDSIGAKYSKNSHVEEIEDAQLQDCPMSTRVHRL